MSKSVKERREALGLGVTALATAAGVSASTVRAIEKDQKVKQHNLDAVTAELTRLEEQAKGDKPASAGNYVKATCECDPPKIIRLGRGNLEAGITCNTCNTRFQLAHDPSTGTQEAAV